MIIRLPFPCAVPMRVPGVVWTQEADEEGRPTGRAVAVKVDEALVREVRLSQHFTTDQGRQLRHASFLDDIRTGRIEGMSEADAEAMFARPPFPEPYASLRLFYLEGGEFALFWHGDGSYDGEEVGGRLPRVSPGEA